jgi:hypothetical protein
MSQFKNFKFNDCVETDEIKDLKRQFMGMTQTKRYNVINGVSIGGSIGGNDAIKLARELREKKVPISQIVRWEKTAFFAGLKRERAQAVPFSVKVDGKSAVAVTKHVSRSVEPVIEGGILTDTTEKVTSVSVLGHETSLEGKCSPGLYIADRVVHHIDFESKKTLEHRQGPYMGSAFLGRVADIYKSKEGMSASDVMEFKDAPVNARNDVVTAYVGSTPQIISMGVHKIPDTGELFPLPQVFQPDEGTMDYESFLKTIPKIMGNLGGVKVGMGYYAQFHVDGDTSVTGSSRNLMDFVTDFRPVPGVDIYYTTATDVRKAWGMYYRYLTEYQKEGLILYSSSTYNAAEFRKYYANGTIKKGGVVGVPHTMLSVIGRDKIGYYNNKSVSVIVKLKTVEDDVSNFESLLESVKGYAHVQLSIGFPVALTMARDRKIAAEKDDKKDGAVHFRMSASLRTCKVIYDDKVKIDYDKLSYIYCWGLQHAYYWRWLSKPLLCIFGDVIQLSPRYQYYGPEKQKIGFPKAMFSNLSAEEISLMAAALPMAQIVVQEEEEEGEPVVPLKKSVQKKNTKQVSASSIFFG